MSIFNVITHPKVSRSKIQHPWRNDDNSSNCMEMNTFEYQLETFLIFMSAVKYQLPEVGKKIDIISIF